MKKIWIIGIAIVSVFSALSVYRLISVWPKENFEQKIVGSASRQGEWFTRNQTNEGDFVYERIVATGEVKEGNNIVRQAGALYGLAQLHSSTKDAQIEQALERGFTYFRGLTATPSANVNKIVYFDDTQSNTNALLVLALVEYIEADKTRNTTTNLEYLVRLSNFLIATQATNGSYINDYTPRAEESDYNNGETMYALIRSYNVTQNDTYLTSVKRFANYAMTSYGMKEFNSSFFSWGMAGFAYLYKTDPSERYWKFLQEYTDKYMENRGSDYEQFVSGKTNTVLPPGAAVFLEGVDHVAWIAREKDGELYRILRRHIQNVLTYLVTYEIGGPYGKYTSPSDTVIGAVCSQTTCETTRIDFLQHLMSAILLYVRFLH